MKRLFCIAAALITASAAYSQTVNYSVEETYSLASLFANNGVELVLTGHDDHIRSENVFSGVTYHILGCLKPADECGYTIYSYGDTIERKYVSVK